MRHRQKIILFGGSFDPVHNGHLIVARDAFRQLSADRLIFIPARRSPHKTTGPIADGPARAAMLRLAIDGRDGFEVSDCELNRPEPSYTLDTVRHFRRVFGEEAILYWLIGADTVADLPRWHHIETLLEKCRLCVMYRGGCEPPDLDGLWATLGDQRVRQLHDDVLATPMVNISSTTIRAQLAAGLEVDKEVPPAVLAYIRRHGLYAVSES